MTLTEYVNSKGLRVKTVCQKIGVRRQTFSQYGRKYDPTLRTLEKIATAMTDLGVPTTVVELTNALYE